MAIITPTLFLTTSQFMVLKRLVPKQLYKNLLKIEIPLPFELMPKMMDTYPSPPNPHLKTSVWFEFDLKEKEYVLRDRDVKIITEPINPDTFFHTFY